MFELLYALCRGYELTDYWPPLGDVSARVLPAVRAHAPPEATARTSNLSRAKTANPSCHVNALRTKPCRPFAPILLPIAGDDRDDESKNNRNNFAS